MVLLLVLLLTTTVCTMPLFRFIPRKVPRVKVPRGRVPRPRIRLGSGSSVVINSGPSKTSVAAEATMAALDLAASILDMDLFDLVPSDESTSE